MGGGRGGAWTAAGLLAAAVIVGGGGAGAVSSLPPPPPAPPPGHLDIHIKDGPGKATYLSATVRRRRLVPLFFFYSVESAIHLETTRRRRWKFPTGGLASSLPRP